MNRIAIIATYAYRYDTLEDTLKSLYNQVDKIILMDNDGAYRVESFMLDKVKKHDCSISPDYKDLSKLQPTVEHPWAFSDDDFILTCDDDLIYPKNYVYELMYNAAQYSCIATYHGKVLDITGKIVRSEGCLHASPYTGLVDIPGTGVSGWFQKLFNGKREILKQVAYDEKYIGAADFALGHAAAALKIPIMHLAHRENWIKYNPQMLDGRETLWDMERIEQMATDHAKQFLSKC